MDALLLNINNLSVSFNNTVALKNVSFNVAKKEIVSLIGPNGAGKTTLLNCLSCIKKPNSGTILYKDICLTKKSAYQLSLLGIHRTFQHTTLFRGMSVVDNIKVGLHAHSRGGFLSSALHLPFIAREERMIHQQAMDIIEQFKLGSWIYKPVSSLPMVIQKRVELARALIGKPELLLLDEPAGGLSHAEVEEQKSFIKELRTQHHITLLIVEHNMNFVMGLSDRIVVLDFGHRLAVGTPQEIQNNPEVIKAYLGEGDSDHGLS